jgi:hypothetical protein
MRFDTTAKTTDIIMFNSRNLGALIVDEKPHVKSWDEPQYSIQNLRIEESYGVLNEGQAIAVAKNIRVRQNEMSTPARPIISICADNTAFEHPQGLVGATPNRRQQRSVRPHTGSGSSVYYPVFSRARDAAELEITARRPGPGSEAAQCWCGFSGHLTLALVVRCGAPAGLGEFLRARVLERPAENDPATAGLERD